MSRHYHGVLLGKLYSHIFRCKTGHLFKEDIQTTQDRMASQYEDVGSTGSVLILCEGGNTVTRLTRVMVESRRLASSFIHTIFAVYFSSVLRGFILNECSNACSGGSISLL